MYRTLPKPAKEFLAGRWVSAAGDWLSASALGWFMVNELNSSTSTYAVARMVPAVALILFSPAVGPLIQRARPVRVLIIGCAIAIFVDLVFCTVSLSLKSAAMQIHWVTLLALILIGCFFSGVAKAFLDGAEQRFQALLVPLEDQSKLENAWMFLYYLARIIFGALSGVILALSGSALLFFADALTFVVLGFAGRRAGRNAEAMGGPDLFVKKVKESLWKELLHGLRMYLDALRLVKGRADLLLLLWLIFLIEGIVFVSWNFLPELIGKELQQGGFAYGGTIALAGVGGLCGVFIRQTCFPETVHGKRLSFLWALFFPALGLTAASFASHAAFVGLGYGFAIGGWSWVLAPIRIQFRACREEGPLLASMLSLVLYGLSRVSQVVITAVLQLGLEARPSLCLRVSAMSSFFLILLTILTLRVTTNSALEKMFPDLGR